MKSTNKSQQSNTTVVGRTYLKEAGVTVTMHARNAKARNTVSELGGKGMLDQVASIMIQAAPHDPRFVGVATDRVDQHALAVLIESISKDGKHLVLGLYDIPYGAATFTVADGLMDAIRAWLSKADAKLALVRALASLWTRSQQPERELKEGVALPVDHLLDGRQLSLVYGGMDGDVPAFGLCVLKDADVTPVSSPLREVA